MDAQGEVVGFTGVSSVEGSAAGKEIVSPAAVSHSQAHFDSLIDFLRGGTVANIYKIERCAGNASLAGKIAAVYIIQTFIAGIEGKRVDEPIEAQHFGNTCGS